MDMPAFANAHAIIEFAYIASHDLQSPLCSISGFVQLPEEDLKDVLSEDTKEWIQRTTESVEHMQILIGHDGTFYFTIPTHLTENQ